MRSNRRKAREHIRAPIGAQRKVGTAYGSIFNKSPRAGLPEKDIYVNEN